MNDKLYNIAKSFRLAIDSAKSKGMFANENNSFSSFPIACCVDTCYLLGQYFLENGIDAYYVSGLFNEQSHAWLVIDGTIVDITADQFKNRSDEIRNNVAVYVGEPFAFYSYFTINMNSYPRKFESLERCVTKKSLPKYTRIYNIICAEIISAEK